MKIINHILILALLISSTACSTTEKFAVRAPQGTKLYTPDNLMTPAATASGESAKIEIPSDMYCGYMYAKPENSNLYIPFGLDYHYASHAGTKISLYAGYTLASIGVTGAIIGTIAMLAANSQGDEESSDLFGLVFGIGAGTAGVGVAFGAPAQARLGQTAYDYNFGYDKKQVFEMPHLSANLLHPNPPKGATTLPAPSASGRKKASSGKEISTQTESGSKAKKNRSDFAKTISGTYNGTGKLLVGKTIDENYPEISVVIERIDKSHVKVRVIESGEDFFDGVLTYTVTRNKKGGYLLSIDNLPEATITVSKTGRLEFNHKKVNIDNTMYTLYISATKSTSE